MTRKTLQLNLSLVALICANLALPRAAYAVDLLSQDFEGLTLGPIVTFASEIRDREAWTPVPPTGWTVDNSQVPTVGLPNTGAKEFEGWTFVKKDWWVLTAGDQDRGEFVNASGIIAVADPDEWDDFPDLEGVPSPSDLEGSFDTKLFSPQIPLAGANENEAKVFFHSSWKPEDDQKASLRAIYDNGTEIDLLNWESTEMIDDGNGGQIPNPLFKPDATNETITLDLMNPAGASSVQLEFRVFDAANDWWWAFDNLEVFTGDAPSSDRVLRAIIDRGDTDSNGEVKIVNRTGETINVTGYSLTSNAGVFDEAGANYLSDNDSNWLKPPSPGNGNDLSEVFVSPTGDPLADQEEIAFGEVWERYFEELSDVRFEYTVAGSLDPVQGIIEFTGNGGEEYAFLDLNFNGEIEIGDWETFKAGFGIPLEGLTIAQQHRLGDLVNDEIHDASDFFEFFRRFEQEFGAGSFSQLLSGSDVPEPTSFLLILVGLTAFAFKGRRRLAPHLSIASVLLLGLTYSVKPVHAQLVVFEENFDGLTLGPNVEEECDAGEFNCSAVWTKTPPSVEWMIDDSGMPGQGDPTTDGIAEWAGWSFANKDWWAEVAGGQDRELFTRGTGNVMVADPDEWDDEDPSDARDQIALNANPTNFYNSFVKTPVLNINPNIPQGELKLAFDSSWRDEGFDDLDETNNQTATITVSYDGGPKIEVLRWDSDEESNFFHDDNPNERISELDLQFNGSASTIQLEFGLANAWNDWWWAIDNLRVFAPADEATLRIDTRTGNGFLTGNGEVTTTLKYLDISSENGVLTGENYTGLGGEDTPDQADGPDPGDTAGDSPGEQWEVLTAGANRITEAFLWGDSTFDGDREVFLGKIFDPSTATEDRDVKLLYRTRDEDEIVGTLENDFLVEYFVSEALAGDYNDNGVIDAADYSAWLAALSSGNLLNEGPGISPGVVDLADYNYMKSRFGMTSGGGSGDGSPVPEPSSAALLVLCGGLLISQCRRRPINSMLLVALVAALSAFSVERSAQAFTLDRLYLFGDEDGTMGVPFDENATVGTPVGSGNDFGPGTSGATLDSQGQPGMNQIISLLPKGNLFILPSYVAVNDRPDMLVPQNPTPAGIGVHLNPSGADQQSLQTGFEEALNYPERSPSSTFAVPAGTIDYTRISDRGFQLWAKPTVVQESHIVMDTNQHGVLIDANDNFGMRYAGIDFASDITAQSDTWYHLSVVRAFGPNNGSILYVDGVAAAAALGTYNIEEVVNIDGMDINLGDLDTSPLVVGANTGSTGVGSSQFFSGVVDDLEMFVMGLNASNDFGEYVFDRDNDYAALFKPSQQGDLTGDDMVTLADAQAFASNWLFENRLEWTLPSGVEESLVVGDLSTRDLGDFNYDGRVNLADWAILNNENPSAAAAAFRLIQGLPIPEPTSVTLILITSLSLVLIRKRQEQNQAAGS